MNHNLETIEEHGTLNKRLSWLSPILLDLGVHRMEAELDGGGDSGDLDSVCYYDDAGKEHDMNAIEEKLSGIKVDGSNALTLLHDGIIQDANDTGNWYDNEGGSVLSAYNVSPAGVFTDFVSITYHEEDYDEDYEDEDYDDDGMDF